MVVFVPRMRLKTCPCYLIEGMRALLYGPRKSYYKWQRSSSDLADEACYYLGNDRINIKEAIDIFLSLPNHDNQSFNLALKINNSLLDEEKDGLGQNYLKQQRLQMPHDRHKYLIDTERYYLRRR